MGIMISGEAAHLKPTRMAPRRALGAAAHKPTTCNIGVLYWAANEGEWWAATPGPDARAYPCVGKNTWKVVYTPNTYPYRLVTQ